MSVDRMVRPGGQGTTAGVAGTTLEPGKQTLTSQLDATPVQRRTNGAEANGAIHSAAALGISGPAGALPFRDQIQRSFGRHDVGHVKAHVDGNATEGAGAMGAEAFAAGDHVAFAGAPDLHTAAHEAAHVVQQRGGVQLAGGVGKTGDRYEQHADAVADLVVQGASSEALLDEHAGGPVAARAGGPEAAHAGAPEAAQAGGGAVQMRRVLEDPDALMFDPADPTKKGANSKAHSDGLNTLIARAKKELSSDEQKAFETEMLAGMDPKDFFALPRHEVLARMSKAIAKVRPDLAFGDPRLIDSGARTGTDDRANINKLVQHANAIFDPIIAGTHDKDLEQVFGKRKVAVARQKYKQAKAWMKKLARRDRVVADRSGYYDEASIGGLTGTHEKLALSPGVIDNPDAPESIITMIHEALHAGNADVDDQSYVGEANFTEESAALKLKNAAHFEVVPRRILLREAIKADPTATDDAAFEGQTFVPAGTTAGGVTRPRLTDAEKALKAASFKLRESWDRAINLHNFYVESYKAPRKWARDSGGYKHRDFLPYWSKVEKLTIHDKTVIEPTSSDPAKQPVSQIDCALSEGVIRKLSAAYNGLPTKESELAAFEAAHATDAERTAAHRSVNAHRDFLIKTCLGLDEVAPITGNVERDFRVVERLNIPWADVFRRRSPNDFAD
jgi:hypothetical protein